MLLELPELMSHQHLILLQSGSDVICQSYQPSRLLQCFVEHLKVREVRRQDSIHLWSQTREHRSGNAAKRPSHQTFLRWKATQKKEFFASVRYLMSPPS